MDEKIVVVSVVKEGLCLKGSEDKTWLDLERQFTIAFIPDGVLYRRRNFN